MGWIAVDLDGTLAKYPPPEGIKAIGDPVPAMAQRVKRWLERGQDVRIFTARVSASQRADVLSPGDFVAEQRELIRVWSLKHFGVEIPATCEKDLSMDRLYDDRAVTVGYNTGVILSEGYKDE